MNWITGCVEVCAERPFWLEILVSYCGKEMPFLIKVPLRYWIVFGY